MNKKLTWKTIEKLYSKDWVQLINYSWPDNSAKPRSGIVAAHAKKRATFDKLITTKRQKDSAVVYVGERKILKGEILVAAARRWMPA